MLGDEQGRTYTGSSQVWFTPTTGQAIAMVKADAGIAYHDLLPIGSGTATVRFTTGDFGASATVIAGATVVNRSKLGPQMALVAPATNHLSGLSRTSRMLVSIYGTGLTDPGQFSAPGLPLPSTLGGTTLNLSGQPVGIIYASPTQINAVLPDNVPPYGLLNLTRSAGSHSLGIVFQESQPSLFTANGRGTGALAAQKADYSALSTSNPARPDEVIIIYGTGLGVNSSRVVATIAGQRALVHYAGPAPGFAGLDQFNIQVPATAPEGDAIAVQIDVNGRSTNIGTVPVRH
ncbi:MAG: hypothetical protein WD696_20340 [Bryobacteraceae bacterium]